MIMRVPELALTYMIVRLKKRLIDKKIFNYLNTNQYQIVKEIYKHKAK